MSFKRRRDPARLLPDVLIVNPEGEVSIEEWVATMTEFMDAGSPANRIASLRRHAKLRTIADKLTSRCDAANGNADMRLLHDIAQAEYQALYMDAAPQVVRDIARQEGTRKERRPDVTEWIGKQLDHRPDAKSPDLWKSAPDWITEQIGVDRFKKRVTDERKKRRK